MYMFRGEGYKKILCNSHIKHIYLTMLNPVLDLRAFLMKGLHENFKIQSIQLYITMKFLQELFVNLAIEKYSQQAAIVQWQDGGLQNL